MKDRPQHGAVGAVEREEADADEHEQEQRHHLHKDVDQHRGASKRRRDAGERNDARAGDLAADLRHRQQHVDRLADEAHPDAKARTRLGLRRKDDPPADAGADKLDHANGDDDDEPVAHRRKGFSHCADAFMDDEGDRQDETEAGRDEKQTFHIAPLIRI